MTKQQVLRIAKSVMSQKFFLIVKVMNDNDILVKENFLKVIMSNISKI